MGYPTWRSNPPSCRGRKLTVNLGKVQLAPPQDGVIIDEATVWADDQNSGNIFLGGPDVSPTSGFKLKADHGLGGIRVNDLSVIWAIGDAAGQILWIFYTEPVGENVQ